MLHIRHAKFQDVIILVIFEWKMIYKHMPDYQPLRCYENFNVCIAVFENVNNTYVYPTVQIKWKSYVR
jgi:hypothetical protein